MTTAEVLGIGPDELVWVVGATDEESAALDPLPAGTVTVDEPHEDLNAVVLFADRPEGLSEQLDDVLPLLGSTQAAWILYPNDRRAQLDQAAVSARVAEYGWTTGTPIKVNWAWSGVRLQQA